MCVCVPSSKQLLCLKLSEYLSDFHLWVCVFTRPTPSVFSPSQRVSVCILQLLGHVCVTTLLVSPQDDLVGCGKPASFRLQLGNNRGRCLSYFDLFNNKHILQNYFFTHKALQLLCSQYTLELGLVDMSTDSLVTGMMSVLAVLPVVTAVSFQIGRASCRERV